MSDDYEWDEAGEDPAFEEWIRALEEDVIQGEFGFESGEFTVYTSHWRPLYDEGLTPAEAWRRALDGHRNQRIREECEDAINYARIVHEDEAAIARARKAAKGSPSR